MKDGFEVRLSAVLQKALNNNGMNPHGSELGQIVEAVSKFVKAEVEPEKPKAVTPVEPAASGYPAAGTPVGK